MVVVVWVDVIMVGVVGGCRGFFFFFSTVVCDCSGSG